jgi:hypothetical protein
MINVGDVEKHVEHVLAWAPDVADDNVAPTLKDGVVSPTGFVNSFSGRVPGERAVKRVAGVANDIGVRLGGAAPVPIRPKNRRSRPC